MKPGQDPKTWGPSAWSLLHWSAAIADRQNTQIEYYRFLHVLRHFLPCSTCQDHLKSNLKQITIYPKDATKTAYHLHNLVNMQTNKVSFVCLSKVRTYYTHLSNEDPPLKIWVFLYAVAFFFKDEPMTTIRFWKRLAKITPFHWNLEEYLFQHPISSSTRLVRWLHGYHKFVDPNALSWKHYIQNCKSGC